MRLATGQDISQIPDQLKEAVSDEIKDKAREMARWGLFVSRTSLIVVGSDLMPFSGLQEGACGAPGRN